MGSKEGLVEERLLLLDLRGAALRFETPNLAPPSASSVTRPGAGRLLRLPPPPVVVLVLVTTAGLLEEEPRKGEVRSWPGRLALLPLRNPARRFGGSSETALPALRTSVGLRVA